MANKKNAIYINPYTDFGFKKLFGEDANKDLLIDFINLFLPPHHHVKNLHFRNNENERDLESDRKAIFDVHCEAENGERFIVEMQKAKMKHFRDRSLFYTTFPIREQSKKGDWNFELTTTYFIAVLDFIYEEEEENPIVWRHVSLQDQFGRVFSDKLHLHFLQMPAFGLKETELQTHFDKWLYFLSNLENLGEIPQILNEPIFQKGFETAKIANLKTEDFTKYTQSRLQYLEIKATVDSAIEEGIEIGIEKGIEIGIEKGIEKGVEMGIEKGVEQEKIFTVKNCLKKGMSIEDIADICGLSIEKVREIALN